MKHYRWAQPGDANAFFGLMLDNLADLVLTVGLLNLVFAFPATFAMRYMVPGTAIGVLFGDLVYSAMAFRLARRTGRNDITAMPLGLDTPSTFGVVFFVIGPAFVAAKAAGLAPLEAAKEAWHIGICCLVASGLFKIACAIGSHWIRRHLPRAGLLGSLAAIAIVLITFLPMLDIFHLPLVGMASLVVILMTLVARIETPFRVPGALAALLVGGAVFLVLWLLGQAAPGDTVFEPAAGLWPTEWLTAWRFEWLGAIPKAAQYLPIVFPFALATVVGGIDCTESAAAAGDEYPTGSIIAVEGIATLLAGCCGGVIQTTPYIGHPAYKAMGGRAAYTLATALFIGSAGLCGYFGYLYAWLPREAILPILVFVGLEIGAQTFHVTPRRHYAALVLACVPAMAQLLAIVLDQVLPIAGLTDLAALATTNAPLAAQLYTIRLLANGFVITSLLWASAAAAMIDRRLHRAALIFAACALCSLFGVMHSPLAGSPLVVPWQLPAGIPPAPHGPTPWLLAASYLLCAGMLVAWQFLAPPEPLPADAVEVGEWGG